MAVCFFAYPSKALKAHLLCCAEGGKQTRTGKLQFIHNILYHLHPLC